MRESGQSRRLGQRRALVAAVQASVCLGCSISPQSLSFFALIISGEAVRGIGTHQGPLAALVFLSYCSVTLRVTWRSRFHAEPLENSWKLSERAPRTWRKSMKQWRRRDSSGTCVTDPNQSRTQQPRGGLQTNTAGLIRVHSQSALWSPRAAWSSEYHRWGSGHLRSPQAAFSTRLCSNKPEMLFAELQLWSLELLSNRLMKVKVNVGVASTNATNSLNGLYSFFHTYESYTLVY